jgi:hypothetical protein
LRRKIAWANLLTVKSVGTTIRVSSTLRHSIRPLTLSILMVAALSGCAQTNLTPLPDLTPVNAPKAPTPAQQQQAIQDLATKKAEQEAKALKEIQNSRNAKSS